jgi:hypothetical protein
MFKFILVILLVAPDFSGYAEYVMPYDTLAQCEAERETRLKHRPVMEYPDAHYVAVCVRSKPLKSTDV